MSNHLKFTLSEILMELDGSGLIITDQDEIEKTLIELGFTSETEVQTGELED